MRVGDHREEQHSLPMSELWNWGEKGLIDSGLERGGQYPLGPPLLFPHISFRAEVAGRGTGGTLSRGLGEQRLGKQASSPQEPHPKWADSMRAFWPWEVGRKGGETSLALGESWACEELSLRALDQCEWQRWEGRAQTREAGMPGRTCCWQGPGMRGWLSPGTRSSKNSTNYPVLFGKSSFFFKVRRLDQQKEEDPTEGGRG